MTVNKAKARANILAVYQRATDADIHSSRTWYSDAKQVAWDIAKANRLTVETDDGFTPDFHKVAGIIAALSPQLGWKENIALAARCIRSKRFGGHYRSNVTKAKRIYFGTNPEKALCTSPGYYKTLYFYRCIVSSDATDVCLDRHALAISLGRDATDAERQGLRRKYYRDLASVYTALANDLGLKPYELQAITWVTWRREKGLTD